MGRCVLIASLLVCTVGCAGRVVPSMRLSSEPRGTDRTLLPSAVVQLETPGKVAVEMMRPAYVTVYEHIPRTDSLRRAFAMPAEMTTPLDGTFVVAIDATIRSSIANAPLSAVRESCVDVPLGAGDPVGVRMCSANNDIIQRHARLPETRWRFTRELVIVATAERYAAPERIPIAWFHHIDGEPPQVRGEWAAIPFVVGGATGSSTRR